MQLKRAERKKTKIRIGLFGPSGSGKTYSALLLANGITTWDKIAVIDTERGSADLYAHLGPYNTLTLEAPFTPERYIEALKECAKAGMEVVVIDSISHEWDGPGGCLQIHEQMTGNSYTNWAKVTPRHNAFINAILQSPVHVICCGRAKQDYVLQEKNGKQVPEKVGLKAVTREGLDYEMTLCFDLDIKHNATSSKDRTGLFMDKPSFLISQDTGIKIMEWVENAPGPDETKVIEAQALKKEILAMMQQRGLTNEQLFSVAPKEDLIKAVDSGDVPYLSEVYESMAKLAAKKEVAA